MLQAVILLSTALPAAASPSAMKGPPPAPSRSSVVLRQEPVPSLRTVLSGAISLYRRFISPTQGARCGFYPSCSAFGLHAVQQYGPLTGGMMTADRLTRCNVFKEPGPDYFLRPDGKLYDPVEANLLLKP